MKLISSRAIVMLVSPMGCPHRYLCDKLQGRVILQRATIVPGGVQLVRRCNSQRVGRTGLADTAGEGSKPSGPAERWSQFEPRELLGCLNMNVGRSRNYRRDPPSRLPCPVGVPTLEPGSWQSRSSLSGSCCRKRSRMRWVDRSASAIMRSNTRCRSWRACLGSWATGHATVIFKSAGSTVTCLCSLSQVLRKVAIFSAT